jgi:hypothetical protein
MHNVFNPKVAIINAQRAKGRQCCTPGLCVLVNKKKLNTKLKAENMIRILSLRSLLEKWKAIQ